MIGQSATVAKLCAALVAAQAEFTNAPKETKGQVGSAIRYYTDLPTLTDHVRPVLARHGLGFVQFPCNTLSGHVGLVTRLVHESGEYMEDEYSMPAGNGAQAYGSAMSYSRRYALMAVLGIAADDDDGAAASQGQAKPRKAAATKEAYTSPPASANQLIKLGASFTDNGIKDREARLAYVATIVGHDVESSKGLTVAEAGQVINALAARKAARGD